MSVVFSADRPEPKLQPSDILKTSVRSWAGRLSRGFSLVWGSFKVGYELMLSGFTGS